MQLFRASIAHFPKQTTQFDNDIAIFKDGGLLLDNKEIKDIGSFNDIAERYPTANVTDLTGKWILPGLIDSHLHYPQTQSIAHYGEQLLSWLENYTFPTEMQFADSEHAKTIANVFLRQLLKNGTTTGFVFTTVHKSLSLIHI